MKKPLPKILAVVAAGILLMLTGELFAQAVNIKIEAMSPGRRVGVTGPNYVSTGLRVFAKGMKMYMSADTTGSGATAVTSYDWTFDKMPTGSAAVFDSAGKKMTSFTADVVGEYIVICSVNGGAKKDTQSVFASTYMGWPTTPLGCQTCHATQSASYSTTAHATIFMRGITGQLEVDSTGRGAYAKSCVRCHTTGWESVTDNGNFGYIARQTNWDSTWWKNLPLAAGDYWIPWKDMTLYNDLKANYPTLAPVATIGCESCHGAGKDHNADKTKIATTYDAGICLQCHDAPNKHRIGSYWKASAHATMPLSGSRSTNKSCWPCHNGPALAAVAANPTSPDYSKTPSQPSISCQSCHDPHSATNPRQLRLVTVAKLANGYVPPAGIGGLGQLCMNCHQGREDITVRLAAQARVFSDRFYPHYSSQADMYLGTNAYEYGMNITGLGTHHGIEDGCVGCHMATRVIGSSVQSNHEFNMVDASGKDIVTACKECHGEIEEFNDITGMYDYDGNGKIEGAVTEIHGLLEELKSHLPLDSTGEPVTRSADSAKVKSHPLWPEILKPLSTYHFVTHDFSSGIHNTKYTLAILKGALAMFVGVGVSPLNTETPQSFALEQNYPNPFNPSTSFRFAIPRGGQVTLHVFNASGQLVSTLVDGMMVPGNYHAQWNGRDANGQMAGSGVYFYRIEVTNNGKQLFASTKKMMMVK